MAALTALVVTCLLATAEATLGSIFSKGPTLTLSPKCVDTLGGVCRRVTQCDTSSNTVYKNTECKGGTLRNPMRCCVPDNACTDAGGRCVLAHPENADGTCIFPRKLGFLSGRSKPDPLPFADGLSCGGVVDGDECNDLHCCLGDANLACTSGLGGVCQDPAGGCAGGAFHSNTALCGADEQCCILDLISCSLTVGGLCQPTAFDCVNGVVDLTANLCTAGEECCVPNSFVSRCQNAAETTAELSACRSVNNANGGCDMANGEMAVGTLQVCGPSGGVDRVCCKHPQA